MQGTGFYIWQVNKIGPVEGVIAALRRAGARWVCIKVQDGLGKFNQTSGNDKSLLAFIDALKAAGIEVGGWGWINPLPATSPGAQAGVTAERIEKLGLSFFLIDAEHYVGGVVNAPWNTSPERKKSAETYMNQLDINKKYQVGVSTYRFPALHPGFPIRQFVIHENSRLVAPQMYWMGAHNPGEQLKRCHAEYNALKPITPEFPMIPMGSTWGQNLKWGDKLVYWEPTAADLKEFIAMAKELKCPAWGFWSLDWILQHNRTDWLDAIGGGIVSPPPVVPPVETWPKVLEFAKDVKFVNVRSGPEVTATNDIGDLRPPCRPIALEERKVPKGMMCLIGDNMWVAKEYNGRVYFNYK